MLPLVLASSSPYRKQLLEKLQLPFISISPDIDETALLQETPQELTGRLAVLKAKAISLQFPQHLIIGSDEVACIDGHILGKPHEYANAFKQLKASSGKKVTFYTGLALFNSMTEHLQVDTIPFHVYFRELSDNTIKRYIEIEKPYNCAGSIKAEGLGVCLFRKTEGEDISSLMGLPLIRLVDMLAKEQVFLP